jgi:hypothetical protein
VTFTRYVTHIPQLRGLSVENPVASVVEESTLLLA